MRTVSSSYLKMIFQGCCEIGQNISGFSETLRGVLPHGGRNFDNPVHRYPRRLAGTLLNMTVEATGDTAVGVKVGVKLRPETFLDMGYAMTICDDLRSVITLNRTYQPLIQELGKTTLEEIGESAWMKWTPQYSETGYYAQFVEMIFSGYASIGRWLLWGEDNPVLSMHFRHSAPKNIDTQKTIFCDNIIYDAAFDGVEFIRSAVDVPMPNRHPELLAFLIKRLDKQLAQLNSSVTLTEEVLSCVQSALADGRPTIQQIAKVLGMGERTLRRRLEAEGQTFRMVLERARKDSCEAFMRLDTVSQADIALRLGFNDQSAFSRAFKSWFNQTPTQYREALRHNGAEEEF